jgi:2-amino-4-hydroxy-6-hydroxymethyldihydropteridine diphosphokinase
MHTSYIAIGSNLGDRRGNAERAVALMAEHPSIEVVAQSQLREYPALTRDGSEQPAYLNGAVKIRTDLNPLELLDALQAMERELGRPMDHGNWEPRTIDLDILLYEDLTINTERLVLPHPEISKRMFVLQPLCDIAPHLKHPLTGRTVEELCLECC